ncbi:MAG: hypothetical protein IPK83_04765 [Planctomycetes bacterium]|nr:hypothetical protein [Planctomycetota bacterium]
MKIDGPMRIVPPIVFGLLAISGCSQTVQPKNSSSPNRDSITCKTGTSNLNNLLGIQTKSISVSYSGGPAVLYFWWEVWQKGEVADGTAIGFCCNVDNSRTPELINVAFLSPAYWDDRQYVVGSFEVRTDEDSLVLGPMSTKIPIPSRPLKPLFRASSAFAPLRVGETVSIIQEAYGAPVANGFGGASHIPIGIERKRQSELFVSFNAKLVSATDADISDCKGGVRFERPIRDLVSTE